jgi:hypothetical protein
MNIPVKNIIDPKLYEVITLLAKDDVIIQSALNKSETIPQFINSLIAALICIVDRELSSQDMIKKLLDSNPKVQEILKAKKVISEKQSGSTNI